MTDLGDLIIELQQATGVAGFTLKCEELEISVITPWGEFTDCTLASAIERALSAEPLGKIMGDVFDAADRIADSVTSEDIERSLAEVYRKAGLSPSPSSDTPLGESQPVDGGPHDSGTD